MHVHKTPHMLLSHTENHTCDSISKASLFYDLIMVLNDILKGKATLKTTCLDLIVALPCFQNILVKRLTMPSKLLALK